MTTTRHGHHIPETTTADEEATRLVARCGGPKICKVCMEDVGRFFHPTTPKEYAVDGLLQPKLFDSDHKPYSPILKHFRDDLLPEDLARVARPICDLARAFDRDIPNGPEKSVVLRKLLEAKDAAIRAIQESYSDI